ncbi:MAG TPA: hypothetical protein DDZ55_11290 [Firmicutes bacterium]|nr:hypothetical protein [Bacillota bacterium]
MLLNLTLTITVRVFLYLRRFGNVSIVAADNKIISFFGINLFRTEHNKTVIHPMFTKDGKTIILLEGIKWRK